VQATLINTTTCVTLQAGLKKSFRANHALKQADVLASSLLKFAFEYIIRKLSVDTTTRYTLEHEPVQIVRHSHDTNILGRTFRNIRVRFEELEVAKGNCGLSINEKNTEV
jgi:hypothetical protein